MNSEHERREAEVALQRLASCIRDLMPHFVNLQSDGSGSPQMLALRDTFTAFPAPAEVLFIECPSSSDGENSGRTLMRFDMTRPRECEVKFAASITATDLPTSRAMLEEHFEIADCMWESIRDLSLGSCWSKFNYIVLAAHDIRHQPEQFAVEFAEWISTDSEFRKMFLSKRDFTAKYDLEPDPVMSMEDLLRLDFKTGSPSSNVLRAFTLNQLQEHMAEIQPIPQVPDSVKEVIRRAKRLYIYGFFEYSFFTIAAHYAYAAMEAALKSRWGASLPRPTTLIHKRQDVSEEAKFETTGYAAIERYCHVHGWRTNKLLVNGRPFPRTSKPLLEWLQDDCVITEYQKVMFERAYLPLRNSHSHLEDCSTWMPESRTIRKAVEQINILFDSLPVGSPKARRGEPSLTAE